MTVAVNQLGYNSLLKSFEAMLAFHFGNVSIETIEKLSPKSLDKFDVKSLRAISKELGLDFAYKQGSIEKLQRHLLPCIAMTKEGEAIMIHAFDTHTATIQRSKMAEKEVVERKALAHHDRFVFVSKPEKESDVLKVGDEHDKSWFYAPLKKEWRAYIEVAI